MERRTVGSGQRYTVSVRLNCFGKLGGDTLGVREVVGGAAYGQGSPGRLKHQGAPQEHACDQ